MPSRVLAWEDVNLMKHHYYNRHRHPQGITLIEVMFASGIALFGLLVVIALIPLAGNEVRVGLQTDRMASLGRNAVKEFDIRGMRDPNQWSLQDGSPAFRSKQAYAIDPRFVTRHGNVAFPYSSIATGTMPRISLRIKHPRQKNHQGSCQKCLDEVISIRNGNPVFTQLTQLTADQLFMARDDLVLNFPDDRTLMSRPTWPHALNGDGLPVLKRQYRGELSWMATVVPLPSGSDEYVLSIIVFSSRNITPEKWDEVDATVANVPERTASVTMPLLGGGWTGGEVQLTHPIPSTNNAKLYAENVLKLQTNNWVMLSGTFEKTPLYRWYRVLNVGSIGYGAGTASRHVTLQGADWPPDIKTEATIMEGVVGVFEKRIRLETSSLW